MTFEIQKSDQHKWAIGKRIVSIFDDIAGTIVQPPGGESSHYCIFVEWEDGEKGWVSKDEVRRI